MGQSHELPPPDQWAERLDAVLAVVYLIFNQGHADVRTELCDEALRLVRQLQHLLPDEGEVQGRRRLLRSRPRACQRVWMPKASPLLLEQDRRRWDRLLIRRRPWPRWPGPSS